jgi:predicted transcriptional regulator
MKNNKVVTTRANCEKKVSKIFALREKGMTVSKIADKVGLSESGVNYHLNK